MRETTVVIKCDSCKEVIKNELQVFKILIQFETNNVLDKEVCNNCNDKMQSMFDPHQLSY